MINIGKTNYLKISKVQGKDIYLEGNDGRKILLVDHKQTRNLQLGEFLNVFVYVDGDGHLAATTSEPFAKVEECAWLEVVSINYYGAFLDWGLPKNLLVPFGEQLGEMEIGRSYLVRLYLDEKGRIAATAKIEQFLADEVDDAAGLKVGQKVELLIASKTELGYKAIVNHRYWGLLYQNELFQAVHKGIKLEGFIKRIRDDNKIDLTLNQSGYEKIDPISESILHRLKAVGGLLSLTDKSPPQAIYNEFGISKKAFKQAIGALYKQRLIIIEDTLIRLP